ncbi:MAG: hypothetical protein CVU38_16430 [Chloroflexi bacterium HGW-Chloroflexi-1]|nr:MAG: hypothetical protein CVU38_16430 [Chloroflexi bacterium HGW-Chloroflexi-1]
MLCIRRRCLRAGNILTMALALLLSLGNSGLGYVTASTAPAAQPRAGCPAQTTPLPMPFTLTVSLQRPNSPPPSAPWAVPVHLALYPPGNSTTICQQWDLTLDQNGRWSGYLDLFSGTYDVRVKNMHTLRNVKRNVAITGPLTIDMGTLLEGDADNDNRVRSSDFALLSAAYFTREGDPGFDPRADFDEDNRIRSSDFALMSADYFGTGDIEVTTVQAAGWRPQGTVDLGLKPEMIQVAPGDIFTLTLMAYAGDQAFVAMDADIRFPPQIMQVVGPDGQPATEIEPQPPLNDYYNQVDNAAGRILYGAGLIGSEVSGDVTIAWVRFKALQAIPRATVDMVDGTVSDRAGKFVTGSLSGAQVAIVPAGGFRYRFLPLVLD